MKTNFLLIIISSMALSACGKITTQQNPVEGYEKYAKAIPEYDTKEYTAVEGTPTHKISTESGVNFIEGQQSEMEVKVDILTRNPETVKYSITVSENLKDYGVSIKKASEGAFKLTWTPAKSFLAFSESSRNIPGKLFLNIADSTPADLRETFSHVTKEHNLTLSVVKDKSVPTFKGRIAIPNQNLSLGQTTKAIVTIEAFNISDKNDINLILDENLQKPAGELLQTSSSYGVAEGPVLLNSSLTSDGHYIGKYEVSFDSNLYWENLQAEIAKDGRASRSLRKGDYQQAEAVMNLTAKNIKTGQKTSKSTSIKVDLGFKAEASEIISEKETIEIQSKKDTKKNSFDKFHIKSKNSQGNIEIQSISIDDQVVPVNGNKKATINKDNIDVEVTCRLIAATVVNKECATGQCIQRCDIKATSSCVDEDQTKNLKIDTVNSLHGVELNSSVIRQIKIKKSEELCEGAQS